MTSHYYTVTVNSGQPESRSSTFSDITHTYIGTCLTASTWHEQGATTKDGKGRSAISYRAGIKPKTGQ